MPEDLDEAPPGSPIEGPPGTQIERDIAYGTDPLQRMDVYRPANTSGAPMILMAHGGGWRRGDKSAIGVVQSKVEHWIPRGFIFISINYRLSPQVGPLEQAEDVASALVFAQENAAAWGGDSQRVILMGHSAGAHLVSLVTADPEIATAKGAKPWLGTVALDSAAYDVVDIMEEAHLSLYDPIFTTDQDLWREVSPTLRLNAATVPMLLVCSSRRSDACPPAQDFAAKAIQLGGKARVLPVDLRHGYINSLLGEDGEYTDQVDAFLGSLE